jgi:hypothetical protein
MVEAIVIIAFAVCAFFFEQKIDITDNDAQFAQAVQYERDQMREELIRAGISPEVMDKEQTTGEQE